MARKYEIGDLKESYQQIHERVSEFEGKEMVLFYLLKEINIHEDYHGIYGCQFCEDFYHMVKRIEHAKL